MLIYFFHQTVSGALKFGITYCLINQVNDAHRTYDCEDCVQYKNLVRISHTEFWYNFWASLQVVSGRNSKSCQLFLIVCDGVRCNLFNISSNSLD